MKKKILFLIVLLSLVLLPVKAQDDGILSSHKSDNKISSSAIQVGDSLNVEKDVDGVSLIMGNSLDISNSQDYLFAMGNAININNASTKDLFVAGNTITVNSAKVERDVYVAGNIINIKSKVARDLFVAGSNVFVDDNVGGDLKVGSDRITLRGKVEGDAYLDCDNITIEDGVVISGKLSYPKNAKVNISKNATIKETSKFDPKVDKEKSELVSAIEDRGFAYLRLLVIGLLAIALLKIKAKKDEKIDGKYIVNNTVKGAIILLLVPMILFVLLLAPFGAGLGLDLLLLLAYILMIYLSSIPVALYFGNILLGKIDNIYLRFTIMLFIIYLVRFIPIVGGIVILFVLLFGMGILFNKLQDTFMNKEVEVKKGTKKLK